MLGLRGYPHVQGGVERHVKELALSLAALGRDLNVLVRARYVPLGRVTVEGVPVPPLPVPRRRALEVIGHTAAGVQPARCPRACTRR